MYIIKRELRSNLKSLIIWSVSIFIFIAMMTSEFSAYYNNPEMADILDSMPEAMLNAFSMAGANLTTVSGFISMASIYFYIMLSVFAVLLGSSIISKEERDKTVEFLLTLPVSREKLILHKLIAGIISCMIVLLVTIVSIIATTYKYSPSEEFYKFLFLMSIGIFIIQLIFFSLGMLIASFMKRYRKSGHYSVTILLMTYILSIFIGLSSKIESMKYFTPFKYFESGYILREEKLELIYVVISLSVITLSLIGTFILYPKRDINI